MENMQFYLSSDDESEQLERIREKLNRQMEQYMTSDSEEDFEDEPTKIEREDASSKNVQNSAGLDRAHSSTENSVIANKDYHSVRVSNEFPQIQEHESTPDQETNKLISVTTESMKERTSYQEEIDLLLFSTEFDSIGSSYKENLPDQPGKGTRSDTQSTSKDNMKNLVDSRYHKKEAHVTIASIETGIEEVASNHWAKGDDECPSETMLQRTAVSARDCTLSQNQRESTERSARTSQINLDEFENGELEISSCSFEHEQYKTKDGITICTTIGDDRVLKEKVDEIEYEACTEVSPSRYIPSRRCLMFEPLIHIFTSQNRPLETRRTIAVSEIYDMPVGRFWNGSFETFNTVQAEVANALAYSDDNVVVSAPTGSGKTVVFEMAIGRFLLADLKEQRHGRVSLVTKSRKIVYLSPSKALCEERLKDWSVRLSAMNLGIETVLVTGDGDPSESFRDVSSAHVILTTPEKWDSLTRRWTENFVLFSTVKLVLIDEVHLIADENRGGCLEAIISRMKTIQRAATNVDINERFIVTSSYANTTLQAVKMSLRLVAVSATLPNISDIATFLEANEAFVFDESYRPVPLTTHVIAQGQLGTKPSSQFHFWRNLDRTVPEIIRRFCNNRPTIVFCHSKPETEKLADLLATAYKIGRRDDCNSQLAGKTRISKLQRVLLYGVAFHHAGLESNDRKLVQAAFKEGRINVLCATSTLAMGVNLPAHLVVVKGTKAWRGARSGYQDLDHAILLQMLGRAGRPGYDSSGTAVILTDCDSKSKYEKIALNGLRPARSQLTGKLIETINTEISQRVITSIETAINWIKTTLLYIQLTKDPTFCNVPPSTSVDNYVLQLCVDAIRFLQTIGAVTSTERGELAPCPASHVMSQHMVDCQAMERIANIPQDASQCQILKEIAKVEGLQFPVRRTEKKLLNEVHKQLKAHQLEGPLSKVRVQEPWEKAFVLILVYIEDINLESSFNLRQEMASMVDYASRLLMAIEEYSIYQSKYGNVIVQSLKLRRALALKQWSGKDGLLKQIRGVSNALSFSLQMGGISTFDDVLRIEEAEIERIASRQPPFGAELRKASYQISKSRLEIHANIQRTNGNDSSHRLVCRLEQRPVKEALGLGPQHGANESPEVTYTLVAFFREGGDRILYRPNVREPSTFETGLPQQFSGITVYLIASMAGLDETVELNGNEVNTTLYPKPVPRERKDGPVRRIRNSSHGLNTTLEKRRFQLNQGDRNQLNSQLGATTVTPSPKPNDSSITRLELKDRPKSVDRESISSTLNPNANESENPEWAYSTLNLDDNRFIDETNDGNKVTYGSHLYGSLNSRSLSDTANPNPKPISDNTSYMYLNGDPKLSWSIDSNQLETSWYPDINKRVAAPSMIDTTDHTSCGSRSWKRTKRVQQKVQRRAFTHKNANPFSHYMHDPNETETYLDVLSTKNIMSTNNSIIPEEGLRVLKNAYNTNNDIAGRPEIPRSYSMRNRVQSNISRLSNQDLLAQKAAEQNAYHVHRIPSAPTWGDRQRYYSHNNEGYAMPNRMPFQHSFSMGYERQPVEQYAGRAPVHWQYRTPATPYECYNQNGFVVNSRENQRMGLSSVPLRQNEVRGMYTNLCPSTLSSHIGSLGSQRNTGTNQNICPFDYQSNLYMQGRDAENQDDEFNIAKEAFF